MSSGQGGGLQSIDLDEILKSMAFEEESKGGENDEEKDYESEKGNVEPDEAKDSTTGTS